MPRHDFRNDILQDILFFSSGDRTVAIYGVLSKFVLKTERDVPQIYSGKMRLVNGGTISRLVSGVMLAQGAVRI